MSSAPRVSPFSVAHIICCDKALVRGKEKVKGGCGADCFLACQIVVSKKLLLCPASTCTPPPVCLSARPHSVGLAEQRGEMRSRQWMSERRRGKPPSDRTSSKEPIMVLLKLVYWRPITGLAGVITWRWEPQQLDGILCKPYCWRLHPLGCNHQLSLTCLL